MLLALTNARIITPDEEIADGTVVIEDGRILEVGDRVRPSPEAEVTELPGLTLVPGFIDMHVHGGGGFSLATPDPGELRSYARWAVAGGVTSFLASVVAETPAAAEGCLDAAASVAGPIEGGAELLGIHLEGPFVNPARRGALPESWPRPPDPAVYQRLAEAARGCLRVITLAVELPGAEAVLERAAADGCTVALGHSDADYEISRRAFAAGAGHVTHAFNAMRPYHHREPGLVGAAMDVSGVTVELIADGVHLHPSAARMLVTAKGSDNVVLITDGVAPAGVSPGPVTLPDGTIAGSTATMDALVRNAVEWNLSPVAGAVRMASSVPARVLGLDGQKGRIAPGYDADLVALDEHLHVAATWVGGGRLYP